MTKKWNRRDFLKISGTAGLGATLGSCFVSRSAPLNQAPLKTEPIEHLIAPPMDMVRVGYVGIGNQGSGHIRNLLRIEGVEIKAVCDIREERTLWAQKQCQKAGKPKPAAYHKGTEDFKRMCDTEELDLVYNATPWEWHVPISVKAMETGSHAATEVPGAITLEGCWHLVETSEKYKKHCCVMENCNYDRTELMLFHMVRRGVFGELMHAECGYLHDLREYKFGNIYYPLDWRLKYSIKRNADLYPTHGLGPVSQWMDITRGNKFEYLVSMSSPSPSLSLKREAIQRYGKDHPRSNTDYALGDVITTLIKTHKGQSILLVHDTNSPRPYSRKILLQGTKGLARKYPEQKIHIEGLSPRHRWEDLSSYSEKYKHPLLTSLEEKAEGAGHGGMDFIEDYRLIQCLREGKPTDSDVYEGAAISAVVALSEKSIAGNSVPVDFPDFTRGKWKTRTPLGIVTA
ncbi:MAG: twin-arginine translocation signal domain-containing protein [Candidatus Aminicenantes bacterium]|nr:twin-arginine translocation signal domain-containing protein [Candidatus Aminicenantes bacterium]